MSPTEIIASVAREHGVPVDELLKSHRRRPAVVRARHAAVNAVQEAYPDLSHRQLGEIFRMDRTSIKHALRVTPRSQAVTPWWVRYAA